MRQTLNNRQLVFVLFITIITTSVINAAQTLATTAGHGAWISLLCTGLLYGAMAVVFVSLNKMYEGDTLFECSVKIVGKFGAYVLALVYIFFFIMFSSYYCITFFQMVTADFLPKTPTWFLLLISMPFLGFIAYKGFMNSGRLAELVGVIYLIVSLILFVTMLIQGKITNILPLFIKSETGRSFAAIKDTANNLIGIALLSLVPISKTNKKISKVVFLTVVGIALFYILDVYASYAMIGIDEIKHYKYPLIDAIRLVEYKRIEFFQRVDISYQTIGFIQIFVAKGIVYLAVVEYMCKILPKARRLVVVIAAGILLYSIDIVALGVPNISIKLMALITYNSVVVELIIPCALLIMAKVKKNGKKSS